MLSLELSEMDRVTQLQDAIEQLFRIMGASLDFLTTKTGLTQVSSHIHIWKSRGDKALKQEDFVAGQAELVNDLVTKAKQIEMLIDALPPPKNMDDQAETFAKLEEEMKIANDEYRQALERARALHREVAETLRFLLSLQPQSEVPS